MSATIRFTNKQMAALLEMHDIDRLPKGFVSDGRFAIPEAGEFYLCVTHPFLGEAGQALDAAPGMQHETPALILQELAPTTEDACETEEPQQAIPIRRPADDIKRLQARLDCMEAMFAEVLSLATNEAIEPDAGPRPKQNCEHLNAILAATGPGCYADLSTLPCLTCDFNGNCSVQVRLRKS